MDYTGRIITKNPQTPSANGAPGVWTLDEAMQYTKQGKWPPGYQISRSVRLRSSASAYFNRTPASAGNRRTWTWSGWVKLGSLSTTLNILYAYSADSDSGLCQLSFQSNQLRIQGFTASFVMVSTPVYRDPSAWYHIVYKVDTTQATAADRVRVYVNGVEITAWATNTPPPQNTDTAVNNNVAHNIGRNTRNSNDYLDGYFAEINLIDGQALTPNSFGYTDTATGVWQPAPYTGTYGTNGFYLNFKDPTSTTTIGYDYSGNSNNWTANNISVTAGTTYDSMVDVPINWGTDTGVGGEVRGNYATFNPIDVSPSSTAQTITQGNLSLFSSSATRIDGAYSTFSVTSGKWYVELTLTTRTGDYPTAGWCATSFNTNGSGWQWQAGGDANNPRGAAIDPAGRLYVNSSQTGVNYFANTWAQGDIIQVAVDIDNKLIWFGKAGSWSGTAGNMNGNPATGTNGTSFAAQGGTEFKFQCCIGDSDRGDVNFGQRPFTYTAPSGYKTLCTQNLSVPTISNGANYMAATLYTGNGGTLAISNTVSNISFQPDLVWVKSRSAATDHKLTDSVRGVTKGLISDTTGAETTDTNGLTAFGTGGFTLGSDTTYNNSGATYVGWQWQAAKGTTVSNTSGSITSTVSANTTAGFSISTFTPPASGVFTFGHGLGVAPNMVIFKDRNTAGNWAVYHSSIGNTAAVFLNTTGAISTSSGYFNNTSPTSTVATGNVGGVCTGSSPTVAYCFAPIAGYSAFGSYAGNGVSNDGPFLYCGFRPRWLMIKSYNTSGIWLICDTSRDTYNTLSNGLQAQSSAAEFSLSTPDAIDVLSNGFKIRGTNGGNTNYSAASYVWAAFAENPFTIARAR